ncbi:IQ calmodulin-binding motif family protein [Tritrichomonas foetus]|uniref:IQ calmodulin-binding motif family protein n=1 Tax=Tritrichomonas foetus TaxID=1144522 RepID=A0A1J4KWQ2_9EUKA|nr:IQ calmodulin-binding motif family protein [Tritrichomonas foetus]|eukprot:OHT15663.1 IQ calmodulin-binding motif family protein [Tritrichomonas foetus]
MDEDLPEQISTPVEDIYTTQEKAARKIQAIFRGYIYRYNISQEDFQNLCARKIQKVWHEHVIRQLLQRCREILALKVISRVVENFRRRKFIKRRLNSLKEYEPLLKFYPTKSKPPQPSKFTKAAVSFKTGTVTAPSKSLKRSRSSKSKTLPGPKKEEKKDEKKSSRRGKPLAKSMPSPLIVGGSSSASASKTPMKRKFIVELPPPWHEKDPRRLSATAQEELLFAQKSNIAWVKSEIMPLLIRDWSNQLDLRDELTMKNERYKNRMLQKMFLSPIARNTKELKAKNPKCVSFIRDTGVYVFCSAQRTAVLDIGGFSDDTIIYNDAYSVNPMLFDVAVDNHSGHTVGIDSQWVLHLFERGKSITTYKLNPENKIPIASKYLAFDHFGLLWVNLFPQKGPLLCFDPITLQVNTMVNLESVRNIHRFVKTLNYMHPIHLKEQPFGFVATFSDTFDVYLFSTDFNKCKKLHNSDLNAFPNVRQVGHRLILWSEECQIYIYELREQMEGITCTAKFTVPSKPIDVCGVSEPDLIIVSCEDSTVRAYLAKGTEFPMRVPNQKLSFTEASFANRLLGPATFTKSRNAFKEMAYGRLANNAIHIDAMAITDKLCCVLCAFQSGNCGSLWFMNDSQPVKASEFDDFNYYEPLKSQQNAVEEYKAIIYNIMKKRNELINFFEFLSKFDLQSNRGQLSNIFMPNKPYFHLTDLVGHTSLRSQYSFIPEPPQYCLSAYDVFHFLYRSGILPKPLSTFSGFLTRFAPESEKKVLPPPEMVVNLMIPINTKGIYGAIVDIPFSTDEIKDIIKSIDPLFCLRPQLPKFTIAKTNDIVTDPDVKPSTQRVWINRYEKTGLNARLVALSLLEDTVKHELMRRVQDNINCSFHKNLLDKMQPVPSIDIHSKSSSKNGQPQSLSPQPNRNPLLDEKRHVSIYETWSKYTLFGRDKGQTCDLRALHIPHSIFLKPDVVAHFDLVRRVSIACKYTQCEIFSVTDSDSSTSQVILTEDVKALPLSHYLTIHSYLGANSRLLLASRSILANILTCLYQLHKNGVIMRTLSPSNVLLNAQDGSIRIGNLCDCQTSSVYVPLPEPFAQPSNPFLPPEFYHSPISEYTSAFDVWQFGILLLYVVTGFHPVSYGSELLKYVSKGKDGLYPNCNFFYDWLKGCKVVSLGESVVGQRGECFFSTDKPGEPSSILQLDSYKLLPYKNTKLNYDEARLFIEIIASCLQIDPKKRPSVEELLRTYPFNQSNQTGDILDNYMRTPNPNVFVSQFFAPVLGELGDSTFPFTLGIISALLFHEENNEEDMMYAFPLDTRAAERVIRALFGLKFMDRMVFYVLEKVRTNIQLSDVNPTVTYKDSMFDSLLHFFMRFVAAVEHGQGNLINHVDDIIMSLLSLYAANPYLKRPSSQLLASTTEATKLVSNDSSPLFVFTYTNAHALIRYVMQWNSYVFTNLNRTNEHDDNYFDQFLSFSEAVYNFANAMCHSIEKQRTNAIKTMASLWTNGTGTSTVRLFIDFRVPQKVLHCFHIQGARIEAASFICQSLNASKLKCFDPSFALLREAVKGPTILSHCASIFRSTSGNDSMKPPCFEIIRNILMGENSTDVESLVISDVIWSLVELGRDQQCNLLIADACSQAPAFFLELVQTSQFLQKTLLMNGIDFIPKIDPRVFDDNLDLRETLFVLKKITGYFLLRQSSLVIPVENNEAIQVDKCIDFIQKIVQMILKESDGVAKFIDTQIMKATRFEIKESNFMKTKNKAKETANNAMQSTISEVCKVFIDLVNVINNFSKKTDKGIRNDFFYSLKLIATSPIPMCHTMPHPATYLHRAIQIIFLNTYRSANPNSQLFSAVSDFPEMWLKILQRDYAFIKFCAEKEIVEAQIMGRYSIDRRLRLKIFKSLVSKPNIEIDPIYKLIINDMIHSTTVLKANYSFEQTRMMQYPLRSEAIDMVMHVLGTRDINEKNAQKMANIMVEANFFEKERALTDKNDNYHLVVSSIELLSIIINCINLFSDKYIKIAAMQLDSLKMRFVRRWNNLTLITEEIIETQRRAAAPKGTTLGRPVTTMAGGRATTSLGSKKMPTKVFVKGKNGRAATSVKIIKP